MHMSRKTYGYPASLAVAALMLPFLYAVFFVYPIGDDFAAVVRGRHVFDLIGGIDNMFSNWWKWSGRYTHHFFTVFMGDAVLSRAASAMVILSSFALFWVSVFGIAKELGTRGGTGQSVFMATFWLFALICSHGVVSQWYALVETFSMMGAHSFTLLYIWALCRVWNANVVTRGMKVFAIAGCIAATGFYEHSALLVLVVTVTAYVLARVYDHPHKKMFFLLLKVSAVSFLFMYLARGNFRRQTKRGMTFALMFEQLLGAGKDWWTYILPAYCSPVYLAALFGAVWFVPGWKTPLEKKIPAPWILLAGLAVFFGYSFGLTLVHAMSDVTVGETPKLRENIIQYETVFVWFVLLSCREWLRLAAFRVAGKCVSFLLIIGILLAGNGNFFPVLWDGVFGENARYAQAQEKRKAVIARHQGETLAVMPFLTLPRTRASDGLKADPKAWPNKYAGPAYGLAGIASHIPAPETAFAAAEARGDLAWKDAGNGIRAAYVPSLGLGPNETFTFDWLFLEGGETAPHVRFVTVPGDSLLFSLPTALGVRERLASGAWPFRDIFKQAAPVRLTLSGRQLYAIPLPLSDSAQSGVANGTFFAVNGGPFIAASEARE